jgi:TetR/AcrR family transcriptional repressor of nem operon
MAKISGLVWAEFSHEQLVSWQFSMGKSDRLLGCPLNNLMQEMSPLDAAFRDKLNAVLSVWQNVVEDAFRRGQAQGVIRAEVDCKAVALFVVSAWEGCVGVSKNLQSIEAFGLCMEQLYGFVSGLRVA